MRNIFQELSEVNVNEHVEKKKDLSYLSWAWAESELLKRFPFSTFDVIRNPNPVPLPVKVPLYEGTEWVTDNYGKKKEVPKIVEWMTVMITDDRLWPSPIGATVKTTCTVRWVDDDPITGEKRWFDKTTDDELPVMNASNKAIPLGEIDAMNINKTIQRSKTKCIAQHGLGLYIYAGEDLPDISDDTKDKMDANCAIIDKFVKEVVTKTMTAEQKEAFGEKVVAIGGSKTYKKWDDPEAIERLAKYCESIKIISGNNN